MAKELKSTDGFFFQGWMRTQLHLTGGELVAYALVHQFSQSNAGRYLGGPGYLAAWLGCSDNTARKYLHSLADKGLIISKDREVNGVLFRDYVVNYDPLKNFETPSKNLGTPLKNFEVEYNKNNNSSKEEYISINPQTPKKFNFRDALLGIGVSSEAADAWLQVRKAKRAVNTEIAFRAIASEIAKSGKSADECARLAVTKSWAGFSAEWLEEERSSRSTRTAPGTERNGKKTAVDRMLELGAQMFGTQNTPCDEQ